MALLSPRVLLNLHALHPQKRLGQNFLSDPSTAQMIVNRSRVGLEDIVVEIGAGLGALTVPLAHAVRSVIAIEKDYHLAAILKVELQAAGISNVQMIEADVLDIDWPGLARQAGQRLTVFGNLPYNISSPLLFHLVQFAPQVYDMHFMLQKEVVARMAARPGGKEYGRLTVMLAPWVSVEPLFDIGTGAFSPPPRVVSTFFALRAHPSPPFPIADPGAYARVVAAAFGQRRKTLSNAVGSWLMCERAAIDGLMAAQDVDPLRRGETLSVDEFIKLAQAIRVSGLLAASV